MSIRTELEAIEKRVKDAGYPVAELLRRAEINASMWQRWKTEKHEPMLTSWRKVEAALQQIIS